MSVRPEVVIKLGPPEIQQALAIDLDSDKEQALRFIKEKIVDKCFQPSCKQPSCPSSYLRKLKKCKFVCCLSAHDLKG